ncbi:MAG: phosphoglucosamine mutase [Acidobacteriota bacterium]|nr:phosphoglucosamine mutase [Acidobacteriota bacterium]
MRVLFGTDGIRGKAAQYPFDPPTMFALGEALAHRFRRVIMGMDTRESGPDIARALSAGIVAGGGDARYIGIITTPGVAYLCRTSDAEAGISISASHNPYDDNGVKIFGHDGMKIPDGHEEEIEDQLRAIRRDDVTVPKIELRENHALIRKYEDFLVSGVAPNALRGMNVVLDAGNGAAYQIAPEVFRRVGANVSVINDQPNGRNINENAGALYPEGLGKVVVRQKAHFGVAFDGDADRAIFVDDAGHVRDGDEIIYLWAQNFKRKGKLAGNCVVTTVMSNFGFERQLEEDGIELCRAQVGDKYVLEMMLAKKAIIGGEQSGHIIDLTVHTTGDGIHTALVFGELLAESHQPFSERRTFDPMPQILLNQKVGKKPPLDSLPKYQAALTAAERDLDGSGRILVRYSGTEDKVRVMVEGQNEAKIKKIAEDLRATLQREIG